MKLVKYFVLLCLCLNAPALAKSVKFSVVSDVNYSAESNRSSSNYTVGAKALTGFISRANEEKYDFTVFLGDNIQKSNTRNLKGFLKDLQELNTPYYLVMGNKDVHKISGLSKPEYLEIVGDYNTNQKKPQNSYVFYPTSDLVCIVLDNVSSSMPSNHGMFTDTTLKWLDTTLKKNKNKKAIIFQHVPLVEPYDNPSYTLLSKQDYSTIIKRHKNVLMIIAGHYKQDYAIKDEQGIYHIVASSLANEPYNYHEIIISYDKKPFSKAKNFKIDGNIKPAI